MADVNITMQKETLEALIKIKTKMIENLIEELGQLQMQYTLLDPKHQEMLQMAAKSDHEVS